MRVIDSSFMANIAAKILKAAREQWAFHVLVLVLISVLLLSVGLNQWSTAFICILLAAALYALLSKAAGAARGWYLRIGPDQALVSLDRQLIERFSDADAVRTDDYDFLAGYFAAGILSYRSRGFAWVLYPGLPGTYGIQVEGLEGFARSAPMLAAWVCARGDEIPLPGGGRFNAFEHLLLGLDNGTNPVHREYWGDIGDLDQRMVEAGDIALATWMLKDRLQQALGKTAYANVRIWLGQTRGRRIYGGNWHLFPIVVGLVLQSMGDSPDPDLQIHYEEIKRMYLGRGWFSEGYRGRVDHYNAWQFCYFLYFINEIDPAFDPDFIGNVIDQFAETYQYWFTPAGFPISGRSMCYRMAVPTPLILSSTSTKSSISRGKARRTLDVIWSYFISNGSTYAGGLTQGYRGTQIELLENYSGRGSALWSLRSLTAAFWVSISTDFWEAQPEPLEIEKESYQLDLPEIGVEIIGDTTSASVSVIFEKNRDGPAWGLSRLTLWRKLLQLILRRPLRPDNYAAKYLRYCYRSDAPLD